MRRLKISLPVFGALIWIGSFLPAASRNDAKLVPATEKRAPVVLELFTSEGCSSCPPADSFLAKLDEHQPIAGAEIIALEEHVDYWNHQGWIDPFSSDQWTQRQQIYAQGFADHGVYTPELVVDGRTGIVGSHESDAYRVIAAAVAQPQTEVSVSSQKTEKRSHQHVTVEVGKLQGAQPDDVAEIWLLVTESGLHSAVSAGENAGHELHHGPVVRWARKLGTANLNATPSYAGDSDMKLEGAWKPNNLRIVVFVQEKRSRRIIGASSVRIEP
jgi:hypothetical protein